MIGRTNTGAGGGSCLAIIRVLYKAGTNATCTNGTITFLSDQSGDFLFQLPVVGTWTVTGQDLSGTTKTITLTINRGDAKLVTLDTLIPPAYRSTYREVEYLRFLPFAQTIGYGNIPLGFEAASGSWDFELQNVRLDAADRNDANVFNFGESFRMVPTWLPGDGGARLGIYNYGTQAIELYTKDDVAMTQPHTFKVHWSSVSSETKPAILTVDDVEQTSSSVQRSIGASSICRIGLIEGGMYAWAGYYGAIKVSVNNELVHHFVPCKKISSGADQGMPGYFDLCEQDSTKVFKQGYNQSVGTVQEVLAAIQPGPVFGT